jgi:hypothetical protein
MKEFTWQDLLDYLDDHLDTKFDYYGEPYSKGRNCLTGAFFESKDIKCSKISFDGWCAENEDGDCVAVIKDAPFEDVADIHYSFKGKDITTGHKIKKRIQKLGNNNILKDLSEKEKCTLGRSIVEILDFKVNADGVIVGQGYYSKSLINISNVGFCLVDDNLKLSKIEI